MVGKCFFTVCKYTAHQAAGRAAHQTAPGPAQTNACCRCELLASGAAAAGVRDTWLLGCAIRQRGARVLKPASCSQSYHWSRSEQNRERRPPTTHDPRVTRSDLSPPKPAGSLRHPAVMLLLGRACIPRPPPPLHPTPNHRVMCTLHACPTPYRC